MKTINYQLADGNKIKIEVSDTVAQVYIESVRDEERQNRQQSRYCTMRLDLMNDKDKEIGIEIDLVEEFEREEKSSVISSIIEKLPPQQREVADLLMSGLSQAEIARRLGVSRVAIVYLVKKLKQKFSLFNNCGGLTK